MAETWLVWTTSPVTDAALREFAESRGGYWNDAIGDEAVITRGDAAVYLAAAHADDEENVMPDDVVRATAARGSKPASVVFIRIGHHGDARELAEEVAAESVVRWGGLLDRNV